MHRGSRVAPETGVPLESMDTLSTTRSRIGTANSSLSGRGKSPAPKRKGLQVSLRVLLIVFSTAMVSFVVVACLLPTSVLWRQSLHSLSRVARETTDMHLATYRGSVVTTISDKLSKLMADPVTSVELLSKQLARLPLLQLKETRLLESMLQEVFIPMSSQFWPYTLSLQCAWEDSSGCQHQFRRAYAQNIYGTWDQCNSTTMTYWYYTADLTPTKIWASNLTMPTLNGRPWWSRPHTTGILINNAAWSSPFWSLTPGEGKVISVSYAFPEALYPRAANNFPVTVAAFAISGLNNYLLTIKHSPNGWALLVEGANFNLVASTNTSYIPTVNTSCPAVASPYPEVRNMVQQWIDSGYPSQMTMEGDILVDSVLVNVTGGGVAFRLFLVTPRLDFLGEIDSENQQQIHTTQLTLILVVVSEGLILILALTASVAISFWLSRPLVDIKQQLFHLGNMDFEMANDAGSFSHISDVSSLQVEAKRMQVAVSSFSKYVPRLVVKDLLRKQQFAEVGVGKTTATIFFLDIVEFTHLMDKHGPQIVIEILKTMFESFSQILTSNSGVIDKYIGDSIMAFWGCPEKVKDPIPKACKALDEILTELVRINTDVERQYHITMKVRIGMHYGEVHAGNVGSSERLNYTILGSSVNLAARLEPLNKDLHTTVLVTDAIRNGSGPDFVWRCLGYIPVRGFQEPIRVHEYIGRVESLDAEKVSMLSDYSAVDGILCKLGPNGAAPVAEFESYLKSHPTDLPPTQGVFAQLRLHGKSVLLAESTGCGRRDKQVDSSARRMASGRSLSSSPPKTNPLVVGDPPRGMASLSPPTSPPLKGRPPPPPPPPVMPNTQSRLTRTPIANQFRRSAYGVGPVHQLNRNLWDAIGMAGVTIPQLSHALSRVFSPPCERFNSSLVVSQMVHGALLLCAELKASTYLITCTLAIQEHIWLADEYGLISVWRIFPDKTQKARADFLAHTSKITSLVAVKRFIESSSNDSVWSVSTSGECKIWDAQSFTCVRKVNSPPHQVVSTLVSKDHFVWGCSACDLVVWDTLGNICGKYSVHDQIDKAILVSPNCIWLSSGSHIQILTVPEFPPLEEQSFQSVKLPAGDKHERIITCMCLHDHHAWIGDSFGYIYIWDAKSVSLLWKIDPIHKNNQVTLLCNISNIPTFPPSIWAAYSDGVFCIWNADTYHCMMENKQNSGCTKHLVVCNTLPVLWSCNLPHFISIWSIVPPLQSALPETNGSFVSEVVNKAKNGLGELNIQQVQETILFAGRRLNDKRTGFGVECSPTEGQYYGHWKDDEKSGFGVQIYPDGTTYVGIFAHGKPKGQGTFHFNNGDSLSGPSFDGQQVSNATLEKGHAPTFNHMKKRKLKELCKLDINAHIPAPSCAPKWRFLLPAIPEEKTWAISNYPPEEILKPPKLIEQLHCKFSEKQLNTRIFCILLNDMTHELGRAIFTFNHIFKVMYQIDGCPRKTETSLLADAVDDIHAFAEQIVACTESMYGKPPIHTRQEWLYFAKTIIIGNVHNELWSLYQRAFKSLSQKLSANLNSLRLKTLQELGVHKKLWLTEGANVAPGSGKINTLPTAQQESPPTQANLVACLSPDSSAESLLPTPHSSGDRSSTQILPAIIVTSETAPTELVVECVTEPTEGTEDPLGISKCVRGVALPKWCPKSKQRHPCGMLQNLVLPHSTCLAPPNKPAPKLPAQKNLRLGSLLRRTPVSVPLQPNSPELPYHSAVARTRALLKCNSIQRILECINGISAAITHDINQFYNRTQPKSPPRIDLGMDDTVSILTWVLIQANVSSLPAKLAFVQEFIDVDLLAEDSKFRLIQFQQALLYNQQLQWDIKDENGVVVPLNLIEKRLMEALRVETAVFQDTRKEQPIIHWLSEILLICGSVPFSPAVVGDSITRPPLQIPYQGPNVSWTHLLRDPGYLVFAQKVLGSVGIQLQNFNEDCLQLTFGTTFSAPVYIHLSKQSDLYSM
ncbi:adenylate cyclase [Pelomyxa schiedti]|nr:adenylate cyclase [Pelomyxa schiedti]